MRLGRRDFLRLGLMGAALLPLAGCQWGVKERRKGLGNLFVEGGKPLLVSVQGEDPERMLRAAFEALGGLQGLVGGRKVLLKPNFVFPQAYPVTTDPEVILLVARLLREAGAQEVEVFDAPGTFLVGSERETFDYHRMAERARAEGLKVTIGDAARRSQYVKTHHPAWRAYREIIVHKKVYRCPVVINMPCLKRHHTSYLTCALKNNFGVIYGAQRWDAHLRGEGFDKMKKKASERVKAAFRNRDHFMRALAEFADAVRPDLTIVDARAILSRGGPTKGKGKVIKGVNRMVLSGDMVALDLYCSRLMEQYDETYTTDMIRPYLEAAAELGLGQLDPKGVKVLEVKT